MTYFKIWHWDICSQLWILASIKGRLFECHWPSMSASNLLLLACCCHLQACLWIPEVGGSVLSKAFYTFAL